MCRHPKLTLFWARRRIGNPPSVPSSGSTSNRQRRNGIAGGQRLFRRFWTGEDGGAYTLSYVMVVPILMLLTCAVIETTLMMSAKLGTVYAAYSAARTVMVWASLDGDWSSTQARMERAAIKSMVPFASGSKTSGVSDEMPQVEDYVAAYSSFVSSPVSDSYVRAKCRNAAANTTVKATDAPGQWSSDIEVTVTYQFPFRLPGIGRLFGTRGDDGNFYCELESQVTLQNDGPQNEQQSLGIGYGSP